MSSIFDDFGPRRTDDETQPFSRPSREYLDGLGAPAAGGSGRASFDDAPFGARYGTAGAEVPPPPAPAAPGTLLGELPYVHSAPRTTSPVARRVLVGAGSLAVGALAAGGAAFAMGGGGDEPAVALSNTVAAPSQTGQAPIDDTTRTEDVSRADTRPGMCVRLDAAAVAAIDAARAAKPDAKADGRTVTIRLADGDVTVPMSAVKVVKCTVPAGAPAPASTSAAAAAKAKAPSSSSSSSSSSTAPKAATTTRPKATTTTAPKTTTTAPKATTTKPKTTTTTPKATTTTPKSTKTSAS